MLDCVLSFMQILVATIAFLLPSAEYSSVETDKKVSDRFGSFQYKTGWEQLLQMMVSFIASLYVGFNILSYETIVLTNLPCTCVSIKY